MQITALGYPSYLPRLGFAVSDPRRPKTETLFEEVTMSNTQTAEAVSPPPPPEVVKARDPLSELTRRERKALLAMSGISLTIVKVGIMPTKVSALGIDFSVSNQAALLWVLFFLALYFLLAFVSYAFTDYVAAGLVYREAVDARTRWRDECKARGITSEDDEKFLVRWGKKPEKSFLRFITSIVCNWRSTFDFWVPIVVAFVAMFVLADKARTLDPVDPTFKGHVTGFTPFNSKIEQLQSTLLINNNNGRAIDSRTGGMHGKLAALGMPIDPTDVIVLADSRSTKLASDLYSSVSRLPDWADAIRIQYWLSEDRTALRFYGYQIDKPLGTVIVNRPYDGPAIFVTKVPTAWVDWINASLQQPPDTNPEIKQQ